MADYIPLMKIDWDAGVSPGQALQACAVLVSIIAAAIVWYVGFQNTSFKDNARMDAIEARITTDERFNDKWQAEEKEKLVGISNAMDRLLSTITDVKVQVGIANASHK